MNYKGKRALGTGASSGSGASFARELARRGADLVLVARSRDRLTTLAADLNRSLGVAADNAVAHLARTLAAAVVDLARHLAGEALAAELSGRDLQIDILVNNAGFGLFAPLDQADRATLSDNALLNVARLAGLARL